MSFVYVVRGTLKTLNFDREALDSALHCSVEPLHGQRFILLVLIKDWIICKPKYHTRKKTFSLKYEPKKKVIMRYTNLWRMREPLLENHYNITLNNNRHEKKNLLNYVSIFLSVNIYLYLLHQIHCVANVYTVLPFIM